LLVPDSFVEGVGVGPVFPARDLNAGTPVVPSKKFGLGDQTLANASPFELRCYH